MGGVAEESEKERWMVEEFDENSPG